MSEDTAAATGWQVRGSAADAYEDHLVPVIFASMAQRLVDDAGVQPGHRVLDVACGTGIVARTAANRVGPTGAVAGIDVNDDMLATAERVAAGTTPQIGFRRGDASRLPFGSRTFDVVLCQQALQFVPDRVAVLREMRRVATPDGRVGCSVLRSLAHHPVYAILVDALGTHVGPEAAEMMASPFALGDASALRGSAHEAGLRDVTIQIAVGEERFPSVAEFVRREAASSPLAGPLGALDTARRAELVDALERRLAPHLDDHGLVFPYETHVLTASP